MNIKSSHLTLINCSEKILNTILQGDAFLAKELEITVPKPWSEFGVEIFKYTLDQIRKSPTSIKWYAYLPIESKTNTLLGTCGYKGGPNKGGIVEIGYEIAKDFRNQGFATEVAKLLVENAFQDEKTIKVQAHTLAEKNASVRVLEKCNFKFVEEYLDKHDGLIWKWEIEKQAFYQNELRPPLK